MKQTKTTLKELTAAYRAVLRHGILCNAIALGLIAVATPARAVDVSSASDLLTALQDGSEITVTGNIDDISGVSTISGKTNSLNLNGQTLSGASEGNSGYMFTGGALTLTGGGTISGLNNPDADPSSVNGGEYGALNVNGDGTLTMTGGDWTFSGNHGGLGALNTTNANLSANVNTITFSGNTSDTQGGGLRNDISAAAYIGNSSVIEANEIVFSGNTIGSEAIVGSGAGAMNSRGTLELLGATNTFANNRMEATVASSRTYKVGGGAVANQSGENSGTLFNATMVIGKEDGSSVNTFTNNYSSTNGGAVMNRAVDTDGDATLTINGTTTFDGNEAAMNGGAIYNAQWAGRTATVNLNNGSYTFTGNTATGEGGAIYNEGAMTIANATFGGVDAQTGNSATEGGAIYNKGTLTFSDAITFANNTASNSGNAFGGAIENYYGDLTFNGLATFNNNSVTSTDGAAQGGALHNLSATTTFNNGATFSGNTASSGAAIYNGLNYQRAGIVNINGDSLFENNTASNGNGIVFNVANADVDNTIAFANGDATFRGNTGVALWNQDLVTFANMGDVLFANNTNTAQSGSNAAISNGGTMTINADTFTVQNNTSSKGAVGNTSPSSVFTVNATDSILFNNNTGGAIYKENDILTLTAGNSITFSNNRGGVAGPALNNNGNYSKTTLSADEIVFSGNTSTNSYGGAIFNSGDYIKILGASNTFSGNRAESTTDTVKYGGGAISNRGNKNSTQTTTIEIGLANGSSENTFTNNYSGAHGGAIHARAENDGDKGAVTILGATEFSGNSARLNGGAISNSPVIGQSTVTLTGSGTFENNMAGELGGAIYNTGATNINATAGNFTFSGNKSGVTFDNEGNVVEGTGTANDIYNTGSLTLNAGTGNTISLTGGIDGTTDGSTTGLLGITGAGTVSIANALKNQTVSVADGSELQLTDADLTGSNVALASGATINTIDNLINDYVGKIYLDTGAIIKGDIDYANGVADMYSAAAGATEVNYRLANALNIGNGGSKTIHVVDGDVMVNNTAFSWFNSDTGMTLASSGNADGDVVVTGLSGGLNTAVDITDETAQEVEYNLTASTETFDGTDNTIQNATFTITGNGNTEGSNTLVFGSDLVVDGDSELTLNDIVLDKVDEEAIQIAEGAVVNINNSRVGVNLNNAGTLNSDPTIYGAEVVNSGTANFVDDIFENGSSLINNGGNVNLTNVEFVQGSTVDGDGNGFINIQNGQTIFDTTVQNNTLTMTSGANVVVGEHGSLNGVGITAAGGTINLNNGHIDALGNMVANGNVGVSLDANFNSGEYDTISGVTGSGQLLINNINLLSSAYNDSDGYFSLSVVEDGTGSIDFAPDMTITGGTNYFTSVTTDGQNVTFGDKLMNASSIHALLGDWSGEIIGTSTAYDDETNSYDTTSGMTVGGALTALQTAVQGKQAAIVDSATIVANGTGGFDVAAGSIGATHLAANSVASSNIIDGTIVNDDIAAGTITTDRLASQNISQFTNNAGYQTESQVSTAINNALANGTNAYQTASDVAGTLVSYSTTEQMNTAIATNAQNATYTAGEHADGTIGAALDNLTSSVSTLNTTVGGLVTDVAANTAAIQELTGTGAGSISGQIAASTTMAGDDNPDSSLYSNFAEGASVTTAVASLDSAIGTTTTGTHVTASNSVGQNINALDSAIGTTTTSGHVVADNTVGQNINALDSALATAEANIDANTTAIATLNGDENTEGSVRNIAKSYFDLVTAQDSALTLNQANAYTDERIEKLDKDLSAGIASAVALSSVAVSDVRRGEMSVGAGYGYFNGQSAAAFGAAMGISNRWSVNAGAGVSGYDVSFRAGTNYKFKLF